MRTILILLFYLLLIGCEKDTFCWECKTFRYTQSPDIWTIEVCDPNVFCDYSEKQIERLEKSRTTRPMPVTGCPNTIRWIETCCKKKMKVLVACEESQAVCIAFRERGHEAYSCDIVPCSGGHPEWHIQDDVLKHLNNGWDMMIAFPPCTHLAVSGARWFRDKEKEQIMAITFFMQFACIDIPKTAIENPISI